MTGIDPAALTSDEAVFAGAEVLVERFERWGVTGHGLDTTRAILEAVAAALAAQGTGGDDARYVADLLADGDPAVLDCSRTPSPVVAVCQSTERAEQIARLLNAAPASSSTQEGRRDGD